MAHFAEIDDNNTVIRVIVANTKEWCEQHLGGHWVQTSYNTHRGEHLSGGEPLHKNYAGIGYSWDGIGFSAPKPFPSWILDTETYVWNAPTPRPDDGKRYDWNEETLTWVEIPTE